MSESTLRRQLQELPRYYRYMGRMAARDEYSYESWQEFLKGDQMWIRATDLDALLAEAPAQEPPTQLPIALIESEWAIEATRYARGQVMPNAADDEVGTPYERGLVNRLAATFRDGWLAACERLRGCAPHPDERTEP